ncbi:MAG: hypothetical protein IT385_09015 [Deltaproteobacteria bacterium]|nr:hypothetical protein [Deltaproteobacteria bacterium]
MNAFGFVSTFGILLPIVDDSSGRAIMHELSSWSSNRARRERRLPDLASKRPARLARDDSAEALPREERVEARRRDNADGLVRVAECYLAGQRLSA